MLLAFGEIMLRVAPPGAARFRQCLPGPVEVTFGGGEANVCGSLALLGRPVFSALDRHSPGEWYLQAIAVRSLARGSGVGRLLFADAFTRAARAGCETLALDVDAANVRARALYERLGLRVRSSSRKAVLLGGVRVHRMAAAVPPTEPAARDGSGLG